MTQNALGALEKVLIKTKRKTKNDQRLYLAICFHSAAGIFRFFCSRTEKRTNEGENTNAPVRLLFFFFLFFHRAEVNAPSVCRCRLDSSLEVLVVPISRTERQNRRRRLIQEEEERAGDCWRYEKNFQLEPHPLHRYLYHRSVKTGT